MPEIRGISAPDEFLTLLLLVLRVRANHAHDALPTDDLAVLADSPHACSHFHDEHLPEAAIFQPLTGDSAGAGFLPANRQ
jgi:hypothetical protein